MKLTSPAFDHQTPVPALHTCDGRLVSPGLSIEAVPPAARALALIVDDPDAPDPAAPKRLWVHWVLYNLPATTRELAQGASALPPGSLLGKNDWGTTGYRGPCPPIGRHCYFFKLYALRDTLPDLHAPTKAELERAMNGRILATAELIGTYRKGG